MAQSGYSTYYSSPQPNYAYPPPPSHSPTPQPYDPRIQPQYPIHYQHPSYAQQPTQQTPPYAQPAAPPVQRPPSRIDPVPYSPGQQNGPYTAPLPQQQQQHGQYFPSPRSPQLIPTNPYPSPVSPQSPRSGTPHSARRPLPSPRSLPPPPNVPPSASTPVPQPPPSPRGYTVNHRPTNSVPHVFPPLTQPPSDAITRTPSGQDSSLPSSAFSHASTSPPRPLPLPRSIGSFDLASSQSQNQFPSQVQPQIQMQIPQTRALPEPYPSPTKEPATNNSEQLPEPGQKFVPLWKRALPQPGGSTIVNPTQLSSTLIERRSTVSGPTRPLPSPGSASTAVAVPRNSRPRTGTLPPHLQLHPTPPSPQPSAQPPNPPLPRTPNSASIPSASSTPTTSRFPRERSRTLPLPTAAPTYPLPPEPKSPQLSVAQRISESPTSSDDDELTNALLERHPRSPSPQYGIRDLPSRSKPQVPAHSNGDPETTPRARRELPSPGPPSPNLGPQPEGSLALRMAAISLRSTSPSRHGHSQSMSGTSAVRPMPQPPVPSPQQPQSGWPAALPPLPRAPGTPNAASPPPTQSTFAQTHARALPHPTRSHTTAGTASPFSRPRSPRKPDLDLNLDDAPPPSLRRSPAPHSSYPQAAAPSRSPVRFSSPLPAPQAGARSQTAPHSNPSNATLQRTASDATSVFSLSNFPAPPAHAPTSPRKNAFRPPSPAKTDYRPPSPAKPQFPVPFARSHAPARFSAPETASTPAKESTPRILKISFPANADGDSDEDDDGLGPVIDISGPVEPRGGASPTIPRISFGDDDNSGGGIPVINVGGADNGPPIPQISLPGASSSSGPSQRKSQPQTRRVQEALSNPRLEAAKRSGLVCGGCGGAIIGRIVSAMDMRWHPGCFRCCVCDELLENLSSYAHDGRPYCHLDYHEQFAPRCYHCETAIVDERFITLDDHELGKRTYHEQHFFCAECGDPFLPPADPGAPPRTFEGDGAFTASVEDDVGFTVYKGHPYCEACHVRLRMPKCKKCKKSIRDGMQAVEALGGKWCWECFTCASCNKPFENPAFFQREGKPFCEPCFSIMIRNEI